MIVHQRLLHDSLLVAAEREPDKVALVTAGAQLTYAELLDRSRRLARALQERGLEVVVTRELALVGTLASCGEYPRAIELIASGAIRVAPLISAVAPLADGPRWFERLHAREAGLLKIVLCPNSK